MISNRLIEVSKMINSNKVVFDVGSDHGQLPCFLVMNNIVSKAYAGDNKVGPLNNAKETINKYHLNDKVIPVLSDGLNKASDDVEVVTICGMGYYTIEHILNNCDPNKYDYFIVQSNTDVDLLRKYISDKHFTILDETVVKDEFYYQIIKFNTDYHESYSNFEIKYGPVLLKNMSKQFIDYLLDYKERLISINAKANSPKYADTIKEIENILK